MKDFKETYRTLGAYHHIAEGFRAWFLDDNYVSIISRIGLPNRILDLGCGEGCLAKYVSDAELVGVDYSKDALSLNAQIFPGRYSMLLEGNLKDLGEMRLHESSFDCAVCSLTLMYLAGSDLMNCLQMVYRLLQPLGRFVVTYPTVSKLRRANPEAVELEPNELRRCLERAGFIVEEMVPICPLVDKRVVDAAQQSSCVEEAKRLYNAARATMTLDTSYHFVVLATKPSPR